MTDRTLLPNEPRILDWAQELALTGQYLLPALRELEVFFLEVREGLDSRLQAAQPLKSGKPYPLGQCLEITLAVQAWLQQPQALQRAGAAAGLAALSAFIQAGGTARQVWGDLRGEYFQNAFLLGTLYVDVSNDTVVASKPKVEILPWAQARFSAVRDYRHYAQIVGRYWGAQVFPNHVLPTLAPWFPWLVVTPGAGVQLEADSQYMFALTLASQYAVTEAVLADPPMPEAVFEPLVRQLAGAGLPVADAAQQGRQQALAYCAAYRVEHAVLTDAQRQRVIEQLRQANQCLAVFKVSSLTSESA